MAIFGGQRDISLFYQLNKEMIVRIMDVQVLIYKLNLNATEVNIYGESSKKTYDEPVYVHTVINVSPTDSVGEDFGMNQTQNIEFAFLRDSLLEVNTKPEIGDIVEYDSSFWEIDNTSEAQYYASKNPDSWFGGKDFGYSVSIVCSAHRARQSQLQIVPVRTGTTTKKAMPKNT